METLGGIFVKLQPYQAGCKTGTGPGACPCVDVEQTPALLITGMASLRYAFENKCKIGTGVRVKQSGA